MDTAVSVLLLNMCAVIGNVTVFVWRCRKRSNERCSVLSMMIVHLAFFDFICGAYYVYGVGLALANVFNVTNGTVSAADHEKYVALASPFALYFASFYTSDWITLSIAVYSLAVIIPWKQRTTRIIAGISFLLAWVLFASAATVNVYILSRPAESHLGNKTAVQSGRVYWSMYTVGTPKFLKLFSSLKACLPRCQFRQRALEEQRLLLAESHLCTACCVVCYKRNKHRQSFSSESVQTSKLFTESSKREVNELSFGLSPSSEEG